MADTYDQLIDQQFPQNPATPVQNSVQQQKAGDNYDALIDQQIQGDRQQQAQRITSTVDFVSKQSTPDAAAKVQILSRDMGLDEGLVERNLPEIERAKSIIDMDVPSIIEKSPTLSEHLMDANFASIAHDDTANLSGIEQTLRYGSNLGKSVLAGMYGFSEGMVGMAEAGAGAVSKYVTGPLADIALLPEDIGGHVESELAKIRRGQTYLRQKFTPQTNNDIEAGVYSGVQSLTQNLLMLPAAVMTANPEMALLPMAGVTGGQSYGKSRDMGLDPSMALSNAMLQAGIEYGTEVAPMGYLLKDLKMGSPFWKTAGHQLATEIPGEQMATLLQDMTDWAFQNPQKSAAEFLKERPSAAAQTLIATLVGTGGNVTILKGAEMVAKRDAQKAQKAEQSAQAMQQLTQLIQANKVVQRDPSTFERFVQSVSEEGPVDNVYVDANVLHQSGVGDQIAQLSPSVAEQYQQALMTGGQVAIPVAEYATRIAPTEYSAPLLDHLRTDPDGYSMQEAQQVLATHAEDMKVKVAQAILDVEENETFKASQDAVKADVLAQLNALNRFTPVVNELYATLHSSYAAVRAAQLGMTPEQFYKAHMLKVQAERVDGQQYDQKPVASITGEEFAPMDADLKTLRAKARDWYKENLQGKGPVINEQTGKEIEFRSGHKAFSTSADPEKLRLFAALKQIVEQGEFHSSTPSYKPKEVNVKAYHFMTAWVDIGGSSTKVGVMIREDNHGHLYYNHNPITQKAPIEELTNPPNNGGGGTSTEASVGDEDKTYKQSLLLPDSDVNLFILDQKGSNILNQSENEADLVVTHNLSIDNLLHAQKMGGLAVPSLAVTKKKNPLKSFGEITLVGDKNLADPKGYAKTKVFGADIYSPRYPKVSIIVKPKLVDKLNNSLSKERDMTGSRYIGADDIRTEGLEEMLRNGAVMAKFLEENGITPAIVERKNPIPEARLNHLSAQGFSEYFGKTDDYAMRNDPKFRELAIKAWNEDNASGETENSDKYLDSMAPNPKRIINPETEVDERRTDLVVSKTASAIVEAARFKPGPDTYRTRDSLRGQIESAKLTEQYQQFVEDMLQTLDPEEKIFKGFTSRGRSYVPHTLENVVAILKKELRGGENFNYGVGSLRAKFTPEFKSIEQIRKAKDKLIDADTMGDIKNEIDDDFFEVLKAINPDLSSDTGIAILEDAPKMGIKKAAKAYGYDISDEAAEKAAEFLTRLRNLPTEYFEAKILRDVGLGEFKGAIVPKNAKPEVIKALKDHGVTDIKFYKPHDESDRAAKLQEFQHLFFQNRENARGSFNPETNTITLLKNADLSTFLHEGAHYFFENDIAIASSLQDVANIHGIDFLSEGERQILDDVHTLMSWHGIQGSLNDQFNQWHTMPFEERRAYHEKTAESFERYLLEGKAPSIELQRPFQTFRAWMMNVYQNFKTFLLKNPSAGELSDEVRSVFDRMLATTDEIKLAEMGRSMMPLFSTAEEAGWTPEEFAAYHRQGLDATNEAIQELQAKSLRDLQWFQNARSRVLGKLRKQAKERRMEMRSEATTEIMSQPVYVAWAFLTRKLSDQDKLEPQKSLNDPEIVNPERDDLFSAIAKLGGLNKADVVATWGSDEAYKPQSGVFGKPVWRKEGGRSIDDMAEALGQYGYLKKDQHGKIDLREFEEKFDLALRGSPQYSFEYDYGADLHRPGSELRNPAALGAGRLDYGDLFEMGLTAEEVLKLQGYRMVKKGGGLNADLVAGLTGFDSGDELLKALLSAPFPKAAIEALTDKKMLESYGELSTPEAIELEADKAIHNDLRARVIATEMSALDKAVNATQAASPDKNGRQRQVPILPAAAKSFAGQMIARLKIRNIRPGQYASAEVRAAKLSGQARASGDLATAAAEKRNQLIQHYATKAAYDAKDEVESGLRYLKQFSKDSTRKRLDAEYADQIDSLLERFELRPLSLKSIDKRKTLAQWLASQRDAGFEPEIPPELEVEANRKAFRDMTVEEFRGLVDTVKQIEHLGRLKKKLLTAKDQREYEAVRDEIAFSINQNAGDRSANTRTPTTNLGRVAQSLKRFWASHIKAAMYARVMDGGKDAGPVWEYLVRPANERGDFETTMRAEATEKLSMLLSPVFKLGKMGGSGTHFPSIDRSLNREARLTIALNMGNAGNIQRLLGGEGWSIEQLAPVLQSLTTVEWNTVQAIWDHLETYRPLIAEKEKRIYGKEPAWVEPTPFSVMSVDGQIVDLRGGYYPIKYDPAASQRAEEHSDAEGAKRQLQGAYTSATTRRSFTKSRVENVNGRPLLYTLSGLYSGVNDVIHDLAWHEWLIDVNRLLKSQHIDDAMRSHYGPEAKAQFKTWVQDIAEGEKGADQAVDLALSRLRQGISAAGLGFNVMSALIQPLGITQSVTRVGGEWVGRGVMKYLAGPRDLTRQVIAKSDFMGNRMRTRFRELNELRNRVQDQSAFNEMTGRYAYFLMMRCQQMVDVPTWWGAYEKAIAGGHEEHRAVSLADQAVIDSQGSGMTKDLAAIERGGPAQKIFTLYYSFMNTALNIGVQKSMNADTPAKRGRLAVDYAMLYVVPAVLGYALKAALTPGDSGDDDPEKLARHLLANQIDYLMGLMVVVREFSEAVKTLTGANDMGRDYTGPAGLRAISDTMKFAGQASQGEFDDAFRKAAVNLVGDFFGLPSAQINRTWNGIDAINSGETSNPAAVILGHQKPH